MIAIVYTALVYLLSVKVGFYRNATAFTVQNAFRYVLPAVIIIIAIEMIRRVLLAQAQRSITIAAYFICLIADLLLGYGIAGVRGISHFMDIIGLTLFPAITSNLLYHYLAKRYGATPCIVYRLLLFLPTAVLPIVPAISDALNSFMLIILPLAVWSFVDLLYEKKAKTASGRVSKLSYISLGVLLLCMVAMLTLVSGQFKYGLLVIATPSMTGELNVGDAVVYKEYGGETVEVGAIVVFSKDDETVIVHRVVDAVKINGTVCYTTKGDANESIDSGYVTAEDLKGLVLFKVSHIGHPTLWLRDILS